MLTLIVEYLMMITLRETHNCQEVELIYEFADSSRQVVILEEKWFLWGRCGVVIPTLPQYNCYFL